MTRIGGALARLRIAGLMGVAAWMFVSAALEAQLSAGFSVASFQFNLSNPGARSLGMGGAFTGRADDATAAYANPAGLTILVLPEVSFEGRSAKLRLPLLAAEPITNAAFDGSSSRFALDGVVEVAPLGRPDATDSTLSFASLVYPIRGWTLALYRHQLADLEAAGGVTLRAIPTRALATQTTVTGSTSTRARVDIAGYGFATARKVGDKVSLGATLVYSEASLEATRTSRLTEDFLVEFPAGGEDRSRATSVFDNRVRGDDTDFTVNAGVLVRPTHRWSIGLSYRQGPGFEMTEIETVLRGQGPPRSVLSRGAFQVPDVFALGASLDATRKLVISLEWVRVRYSQLRRPARLPASLTGFGLMDKPDRLGSLGRFSVDDADELRAGLEYSFWRAPGAPALRLGAWYDPEHKVRFEASAPCPAGFAMRDGRFQCSAVGMGRGLLLDNNEQVSDATFGKALELLFPPGENNLHITAGFGVVAASRFQIDGAFDYVDSDQYTLSLSGIVHF